MSGKKDFKQLREELEKQGFDVVPRAGRSKTNQHYGVYKGGEWIVEKQRTTYKGGTFICGLPSTPSENRGLANQIAALRRAGFVWKGR